MAERLSRSPFHLADSSHEYSRKHRVRRRQIGVRLDPLASGTEQASVMSGIGQLDQATLKGCTATAAATQKLHFAATAQISPQRTK